MVAKLLVSLTRRVALYNSGTQTHLAFTGIKTAPVLSINSHPSASHGLTVTGFTPCL